MADSPLCLSSLLCDEDHESCFNYLQNTCEKPCFVAEDEDEFVQNMFQREESLFRSKGSSFSSSSLSDVSSTTLQSWLKSARLDALQWIYNTRASFGFHYNTAYLSITYFDRFLSRRYIDQQNGRMWAIRLLSAACLSLAAKLEERNAPMLSEFRVEFESKVIRRMELLVLSALEWKTWSITPFAYLNYFTNKFCGESQKRLAVSTAMELIVAMTKEMNSIIVRPSIVAASAVLVASDDQLKRKTIELKMNVISFWRSEDKEDMYSCCNLLQEIGKRKGMKTPREISFSLNVISKNSSFNSAESTKRRLTFDEFDDQSSPAKKVHR